MSSENILDMCRGIYKRHRAGCCLHIVLSDYNTEDGSVAYCLDQAMAVGHADCVRAAELLLTLTQDQRDELVAHKMLS